MEDTTEVLKRLLRHVESLFDDQDIDETTIKDAVLGAFDYEIVNSHEEPK